MTRLSNLRTTQETARGLSRLDSSQVTTIASGVSLDSSQVSTITLASQDRDNKSYNYDGTLAVNTGSKRLYMTRTGSLGDFDMFVETAPVGANLTVTIKKNGSQIATGSITDGATSSTANSIATSNAGFVSGDYLTVDITQIGSTTAGADLYINFRIAS
jgi:hypothetical protein